MGGLGFRVHTPSAVEERGYYGQAVKMKDIEPGTICCYRRHRATLRIISHENSRACNDQAAAAAGDDAGQGGGGGHTQAASDFCVVHVMLQGRRGEVEPDDGSVLWGVRCRVLVPAFRLNMGAVHIL